jgi:hypothetical protein
MTHVEDLSLCVLIAAAQFKLKLLDRRVAPRAWIFGH